METLPKPHSRSRSRLVAACAVAGVLSILVPAYAAPGDLDPTFGNGGKVVVSYNTYDAAFSAALQADGKIVVAGKAYNGGNDDFALLRLNADGTLDSGFGSGGKVVTPVGSYFDGASSVAVQGDGKIVVAGNAYNGGNDTDFAVLRYNADGTPDSGFGSGGQVITAVGTYNDDALAVAVQGDGKIVVAGSASTASGDGFALVRYNTNGTLDNGFGNGGKVITVIGDVGAGGQCVALQSDGKIIVGGYASNGANYDFAVARYNTDGTLDSSFGTGGTVTTPISSSHEIAFGVAVQGDGKIVLAGETISGSNIALVRYNADGTLDSSFGSSGKATTSSPQNYGDTGTGVAVLGDGKIVVTGSSNSGFLLARFNANGTLDSGFGIDGKVTTAATTYSCSARSVVAQGDGKIVVTGYGYSGNGDSDFAVVRYEGGQRSPDVTTGGATAADGGNSVALDGTANPFGASTDAWFEYDTDITDGTYAFSASAQNIGAGSSAAPVNQNVSIAPHATYHYRLVATNSGGTSYGTDATYTNPNREPVAVDDTAATSTGGMLTFDPRSNDSDPDNDGLSISAVGAAAQGTTSTNGTSVTYQPAAGYTGTDSFTYTIDDGHGGFAIATVNVTVSGDSLTTILALKGATVPGAAEAGSGIPAGATWSTFGIPSINDAGEIAFLSRVKLAPRGSLTGIFAGDPAVPGLLVKRGDAAPDATGATAGRPLFSTFKDPLLTSDGRVTFVAYLTGAGASSADNKGIYSTLFGDGSVREIARKGTQPPGAPAGALWKNFVSVAAVAEQDGDGRAIAFTATMVTGADGAAGPGGVTAADDLGLWIYTEPGGATLALREGSTVSWLGKSHVVRRFSALAARSGAPAHGHGAEAPGWLAVLVTFEDGSKAVAGVDATGLLAINGLEGEAAPRGGNFTNYGLPVTAANGVAAFTGSVKANSGTFKGIFAHDPLDGFHLARYAATGETAQPGGVVFATFGNPVTDESGGIAFLGGMKGPGITGANNTGLWWTPAGGDRTLLAQEGGIAAEAAPAGGIPAGVEPLPKWKAFNSLALPDGGRGPLFVASLINRTGRTLPVLPGPGGVTSANDMGLWGVDSVGRLRLLVREGDTIDGRTLKYFTLLRAVSASPSQRRSFNNEGSVIYRAVFTDGLQAVVKVQLP